MFQAYYETDLLKTSTPSAISWIGSVQSFLLLGGGIISGPLFDAGYFRILIATGTFLITFGPMMTSLSSQYWHILLAQGFCSGFGAGCMVVPALSLLPQYFRRHRALVTGIAVSGSSVGGVIFPIAFQGLLPRIGFGWTNRVLGLISLSTCSFAVAVMRTRDRPRRVRSLVDPSAFREAAYLFYCAAMFCSNFGFFVPIFYLQTYAMSHGLTNRDLALHIVAILNAGSVLGRLAPSQVAVWIGPVNTMITVSAMAGVVAFSWIAVNTAAGNVVFAVLYGFTSGGIVSLPAVVLASITEDLGFMGARLGTANFFNAIGSLCGAPLAGAILRSTGRYLGIQLFAGFVLTATAVCLIGTRVSRVGTKLLAKV